MVWTDLVAGATGRLVHGSHQGMFERRAWPAHAENNWQDLARLKVDAERTSERPGWATLT
jgi:hypothetical protein